MPQMARQHLTQHPPAWTAWSAQLQEFDARTLTLLRAAFDAGMDAAGRVSAASALGRLGASKGGAARAASLTKKRRIEIAKEAAKERWGDYTSTSPSSSSGSGGDRP